MYEFYSRSTSTLAEDDIRGLQHIYGVPPNRKYTPPPKLEDSDESMPVWSQTPVLPNKCYSTYDAIAMIDDKLIAFRGKYMFGPKLNMTEFRSRWKDFSPKTTHVDAVFQTTDKKVLFFMNQNVFSFVGNKIEKSYKLKDLGIEPDALKIDSIFRKSDNNQIYIFVKNNYYKFDEHKMEVTGPGKRITEVFKDVYDLDTAFTYTNNITYFFKNESYYEFDNSRMRLNRMKPGLSANYFMECNVLPVIDIAQRFNYGENEGTTDIIDYIDGYVGVKQDEEEVECNPESSNPCQKGSASSIKSFSILAAVLILSNYFI